MTAKAVERRILIVAAHPLISSSLAMSLRQSGFAYVETTAPDDLAALAEDAAVDLVAGCIVLVNLLHDGRAMLPLIEALARQGGRVVGITSREDPSLPGDCLRRGAETIVDATASIPTLVDVLRRVMSGERTMTTEERAALLEAAQRRDAAEAALHRVFDVLTQREADVLADLVAGAAPKQIAQAKGISLSTVRGHIRRVLSKLDVSSQREALAMARHAGWPGFCY